MLPPLAFSGAEFGLVFTSFLGDVFPNGGPALVPVLPVLFGDLGVPPGAFDLEALAFFFSWSSYSWIIIFTHLFSFLFWGYSESSDSSSTTTASPPTLTVGTASIISSVIFSITSIIPLEKVVDKG